MSKQLPVKVSSRKSGDEEWYEATVSVPGLKPTKLARKTDGNTKFNSRSALNGAARNLAKTLGFTDVDFGQEATKKAAKKATSKSAPATRAPATTPAEPTATATI